MKMENTADREHNYKPNFGKAVSVEAPLNAVRQYLGDFDANKEWNRNRPGEQYDANIKFLIIDAYKRFIEEDSLILVGRTGTGKTAILNRYMYDVLNGKIKNIKSVLKLDLKQYIMQLAKYGEVNGRASFAQNEIENNIEMIVNLAIMQNIVKYHNHSTDQIEKMAKYLNSEKITRNTNLLSQYINELGKIFEESNFGKIISTVGVLAKFAQKYQTAEYEEAVEALHVYLDMNSDFLVLIDSMDEYDRDTSSVLVVKALIESCYKFYNENINCHIQLKIALPAEIYSDIVVSLPEKHQSNTIFIEWKYRDLVKMIAIRTLYYGNHSENSQISKLSNGYVYSDFYEDYEKSKEYLNTFLPLQIPTNLSMCFDSIAYCIRHTQKKPRQAMRVFNAIIDVIERKADPKYFYSHSSELSHCVHMVQNDMLKDALSMYKTQTDNSIFAICDKVLMNREAVIDSKKMMDYIKEASSIYRKINLSDSEVLAILVESGILGKRKVEEYIEPNNNFFKNDKTIKIIKTLFEYQIKDRLRFARGDKYVIHPMCYEHFTNLVDRNAMIYPEPIDDDEDVMNDWLRDKTEII